MVAGEYGPVAVSESFFKGAEKMMMKYGWVLITASLGDGDAWAVPIYMQ